MIDRDALITFFKSQYMEFGIIQYWLDPLWIQHSLFFNIRMKLQIMFRQLQAF